MLDQLFIENIAVIEQARLELGAGFNVMTGETGAGKSIILDSLCALTGARTGRDIIRTGHDKASVSAVFSDISAKTVEILENAGFRPENDGTLLLSRELYADGRNVCRINGRPATLGIIREIGEYLVSIHGQHDGRQLLDVSTHLDLLDRFARCVAEKEAYTAAFHQARELKDRLTALTMDEDEKARKLELLRFQINDIDQAGLKNGEDEELIRRRQVLQNAEKLLSACDTAYGRLAGGQDGGGVCESLSAAHRQLVQAAAISADAQKLADRVGELMYAAEDCAREITAISDSVGGDPGELEAVEDRLDLIEKLCKKHGGTIEAVLSYRDRAANELDDIEFNEEKRVKLTDEYSQVLSKTREAAKMLSNARKAAAKNLEKAVMEELAYLEMTKTRFEVRFGEVRKLMASGADEVEFFIAPNVGEELRPLARIASGGELSRIMLALRNVFRDASGSATLVFDEIDTGVSGRAAQRVGEKLYGASRGCQVLCVTHLTQIASMADRHFMISKEVREDRTITNVYPLDRDGRIRELARIAGGFHITDTLLQSAAEQLDAAGQYKRNLLNAGDSK